MDSWRWVKTHVLNYPDKQLCRMKHTRIQARLSALVKQRQTERQRQRQRDRQTDRDRETDNDTYFVVKIPVREREGRERKKEREREETVVTDKRIDRLRNRHMTNRYGGRRVRHGQVGRRRDTGKLRENNSCTFVQRHTNRTKTAS